MFITDRAASEIKGDMEKLIEDANTTNYGLLSQIKKEATKQWGIDKVTYPKDLEQGHKRNTEEDTNNNDNYIDFDGKTLQELRTKEKLMLLRDAEQSIKPPLNNLILTHNPTSYINMHPQTGTSLGKLDKAGRSLQETVRLDVASTKTPTDGSYIQLLVESWNYYNNFLKKDPRRKKMPAEVHLGSWKASNTSAMYKNIRKAEQVDKDTTMGKLQEMLELAYKQQQNRRQYKPSIQQ